ncbi:MAG: hypothetical protein ABSB22_26355, partial [Thermodesulfobacteriota bacterium]
VFRNDLCRRMPQLEPEYGTQAKAQFSRCYIACYAVGADIFTTSGFLAGELPQPMPLIVWSSV